MVVTYKNKNLEKICTDISKAIREYGFDMAKKIHQRVKEISIAPNVEMMIQFHIGRCHKLEADRDGQYAVDLIHPFRLIFTVTDNQIQIAKIIEIVDYH